jgi:hypothetical protein
VNSKYQQHLAAITIIPRLARIQAGDLASKALCCLGLVRDTLGTVLNLTVVTVADCPSDLVETVPCLWPALSRCFGSRNTWSRSP